MHQQEWLSERLNPWLERQAARHVVYVAGNHDFLCEKPHLMPKMYPNYLNNCSIDIDGLKVWGSPWSSKFMNWAFGGSEGELSEIWQSIPDDTDIVIVHGPPRECGDVTFDGISTGSPSLSRRLHEVQPKLVVCGHIHEGYGVYRLGDIKVINASLRNEHYKIVNAPVVAEID